MALTVAMDLLLPRTDAGVIVQAMVFVVVLAGAFVAVRHEPEYRLLIIGVGVLGLAFFALRSLH